MSDPLYDDVKELLENGAGDERILKQILRACENNEVISNYERSYVQKLAERYLGKKPFTAKPIEKPTVPDVILPQSTSTPKSQIFQTTGSPITKTSPKNTKMLIGLAAGALAVILVIAAATTGIADMDKPRIVQPISNSPDLTSFSVDTDANSYSNKDIISISGFSPNTGNVELSIVNSDGTIIWTEQVKIKNNGQFSTLLIAGGPGWNESGTFTLKATSDTDVESKTFTFTA